MCYNPYLQSFADVYSYRLGVIFAGVAQSVEQGFRKAQAKGSNPFSGFVFI